MPSNTLVYGEFGNEIYGNSGAEQTVIPVFHIIDALMLGGMDLRNVHCTQRYGTLECFFAFLFPYNN